MNVGNSYGGGSNEIFKSKENIVFVGDMNNTVTSCYKLNTQYRIHAVGIVIQLIVLCF